MLRAELARCRPSCWCTAIAICIVTAGSAVAPCTEPEHETISENSGFSTGVGCTRVVHPFSGEVLFRASGEPLQPLLDAAFQCDSPWDEPAPCEVTVAPDGSFRGSAKTWDHIYVTTKPNGKAKEQHQSGKARVTVSAPGCVDRSFTVGRRSRDRRIVLKCKDRTGPSNEQSN